MKRVFLVFIGLALAVSSVYAVGGKQRLGNPEDITEIFQLCQQLGVDDNTTVTVEECTEDVCTTYKVVCSQDDNEEES